MNEEGLSEGPFLQDPLETNSQFPDMSLTMLAGMKPSDYTSFNVVPLQQYVFQDYLPWSTAHVMFPPHEVYLPQPPPLEDMFEPVDPAPPVVLAPEAPTTVFEMDATCPEIMRMCMQDAAGSDGYPGSATPASSSATDSMVDVRDLPTDAEMCMTCFGVFPSRASLSRHIRLAHPPRVWNLCDVCGKALATPRSLRMHKLRHTGVKTCVCADCGAAFYEQGQLRAHQRAKHPQPVVKDLMKDAALDVGLHVVHQQGGADQGGGGGGVVFRRAETGDVVGIVAAPRAVAPAPPVAQVDEAQAEDGDDGIVIRLVRCKEQEGAWKVVHVSKIY